MIDKYDQTIYIEEALHRLVEIYYTLGLKEEGKKYANLLGYNYNSSIWYEKTYAIFDKIYLENKKDKLLKEKKKNNILNKFKSIFK